MSGPQESFQELLSRVRSGDNGALMQLIRDYETEVRIVARARIGAALRPYVDSVDVVQSVHRSLMIGLRDGRFDISTPSKLLALALTIVRRKVARDWRRVRRQQRLSGVGSSANEVLEMLVSCGSRDSDPERIAILNDAVRRVYEKLAECDQRLIQLRLDGYTTAEAADQIGINADHARTRLLRARRHLEHAGITVDLG
jgi:RNA polymerase sigma-70 factor (ECF subfamily)